MRRTSNNTKETPMTRTALTIAATAALTLGLAAPAVAAPPGYYQNASVTLPTCTQIGNAPALEISTRTFTPLGDRSNPLTGAGYGTEMPTGKSIIEDGGRSCTWLVGSKKTLTISVAPLSPYDRGRIPSLYLSTYGSVGSFVGGNNFYYGGQAGIVHEVGFLLEEGVWVTGKVTDDGDFFPAVLQDVSDMVYHLND
jgi:hypothetical protein